MHHGLLETQPLLQLGTGWGWLLLESFTRSSIKQKCLLCLSSSSSCSSTALSLLPVRQQQLRGFEKIPPHLQLPLSSSLPASAGIVTSVCVFGENSHFLSFVLQQKNRLTRAHFQLWRWGNSEVTKLNSVLAIRIIRPQWPHLDIAGTKSVNRIVLDCFLFTFQFPFL